MENSRICTISATLACIQVRLAEVWHRWKCSYFENSHIFGATVALLNARNPNNIAQQNNSSQCLNTQDTRQVAATNVQQPLSVEIVPFCAESHQSSPWKSVKNAAAPSLWNSASQRLRLWRIRQRVISPALTWLIYTIWGKVKFKDKHRAQWECVYIWIIAISP